MSNSSNYNPYKCIIINCTYNNSIMSRTVVCILSGIVIMFYSITKRYLILSCSSVKTSQPRKKMVSLTSNENYRDGSVSYHNYIIEHAVYSVKEHIFLDIKLGLFY